MEKLTLFRNKMRSAGVDAYILPTVDPHFSEYTAEYWKARKWLSGFSGSAGTLVLTLHAAALWTDSRYFEQASIQLSGSGIVLQKMGEEGTPEIESWLMEQLPQAGCIGMDGRLISHIDFVRMQHQLPNFSFQIDQDLCAELWKDRPALPVHPVWKMSDEAAGMSVPQKCESLTQAYAGKPYLLTALDEIAWLFNIRGNDIAYNPVCTAYAIVGEEKPVLFLDSEKLSPDVRNALNEEGVEVRPYESLLNYCARYKGKTLIYNPAKTNQYIYAKLNETGVLCQRESPGATPISLMKACKTEAERQGFKKAMYLDGLAWVRLLSWMECHLEQGLSEMQVAEAFSSFRREGSDDYIEESFAPIVAYGEHGAIVHYEPSKESDMRIGSDRFLLMDTGAHYRFGTTDTTRTWHFGKPNDEQIKDYTLVLQGMIRLSMAQFPKGTRGAQLDMLARQPLMSAGMSFSHGTGHGIGHVLCVHEGPQSIRLQENPVQLQPGMIQSNEPAVYKSGSYGIRIENVLLVVPSMRTSWGEFYCFETLTLVPICMRAVDLELLSSDERLFLMNYQQRVYDTLAEELNPVQKQWLKENTIYSFM